MSFFPAFCALETFEVDDEVFIDEAFPPANFVFRDESNPEGAIAGVESPSLPSADDPLSTFSVPGSEPCRDYVAFELLLSSFSK
jgi:hypothetical protein